MSSLSLSLVDKKYKAFTLAEILLSLTVIGIVAAIALPSLLGNANERAWETQKKAFYTRFSQAIPLLPSLNGYGELVGNLQSTPEDNRIPDNQLKDTAAETFVRDGLSKVMKITNICDNDHLSDCGLSDKIITLNGSTAIELSSIKTLGKFNEYFLHAEYQTHNAIHEQLDTKAASFETVNGESILVYYNPNCEPDLKVYSGSFPHLKMCANFIYDLNGKKGPNTVGKDIGFITALYSTESVVVAPNPYSKDAINGVSHYNAAQSCKDMDINAKVPNKDELAAMNFNYRIINMISHIYWSSSVEGNNNTYAISQDFPTGWQYRYPRTDERRSVRCIKR